MPPHEKNWLNVSMSDVTPSDEGATPLLGVLGDGQRVDVGEQPQSQAVEGLLWPAGPDARPPCADRCSRRPTRRRRSRHIRVTTTDVDAVSVRPWSIVCWMRIGVTRRPAAPPTARSTVSTAPLRSSGLARQPWRSVSIAPSSRRRGGGVQRSRRLPTIAVVRLYEVPVGGTRRRRSASGPLATTRVPGEEHDLVDEGDGRRTARDDDCGDALETTGQAGQDAGLACSDRGSRWRRRATTDAAAVRGRAPERHAGAAHPTG